MPLNDVCESCKAVTPEEHRVIVNFVLTDQTLIETVMLCFRCYYQKWD